MGHTVARTIVLVALALASVIYAGSRTAIERECLAFQADMVYAPAVSHYVIGAVTCSTWGGLVSRNR